MNRIVCLALLLSLTACTDSDSGTGVTLDGSGSERELEVMRDLEAAAADGDLRSEYLLVAIVDVSQRKDYVSAIPKLESLADRGSADAANTLARIHRNGQGVEVDFDESARWLERASDLGDEQARQELASYTEYKATAES